MTLPARPVCAAVMSLPMNRFSTLIAGTLLAAAALSGGCGVQQTPFNFHSDGDLAHYNKIATEIEYPNVADCPNDNAINCPSPETIGPDSQPPYWDLKLEEAMQLGLAKSKVLHDLGGTVLRSPPNTRTIADPALVDTDPRYGVEAALSEFDTVFNEKFDYQRNNRFVNNVFFGGGTRELRQDTDIFRSELTKTAATGGTFTLAHNTVYDHNNSPGNLFPSSWDTNFEASWRQPLLQGAGVEYNRIAGPKGSPGNLDGVLIARVNTDISLADFEMGLRDLVSNIENAYWDLYFAYRDLDAKIVARDNALDSWRKTHALFVTGRRGGEAEKEAEAREQYFSFQEEVQNAWSGRLYEPTQTNNGSGGGTFRATGGVRVCERRLRYLLGLPMSDGRLIRPGDEPSLAKVVFNWDDVLPESINRRSELRRQRWIIKRDELSLIASKNFLLPKLDAFGLYRVRGFGHDLKDGPDNTPENSAFEDLTHGDHQEWEAGLQLSVPLGERQGHAAVRNAQLLLSRDRAILDDQEKQVVLDLSNAMAEVDRAYQVAQTAFNRRMAAKADVSSTKAAYESDKAPLDLYLDAQRRNAVAESQFFAALVEYALAIKNLHYSKGSLLDYNEVYLAEGPWPGKAYCDAADRRASRWQPKALNYIFHQPPPVSIGTEPNYPLPPPIGPFPRPPGPDQTLRPQPEELPKTAPQPPVPPQPQARQETQPPLLTPTFAHTPVENPIRAAGAAASQEAPQAAKVAPSRPAEPQTAPSIASREVAAKVEQPKETAPRWPLSTALVPPSLPLTRAETRSPPVANAGETGSTIAQPVVNPVRAAPAWTAPAAPSQQAAATPFGREPIHAQDRPVVGQEPSRREEQSVVQFRAATSAAVQPVVQPAKPPATDGALNWLRPLAKPGDAEHWSLTSAPNQSAGDKPNANLRPQEVDPPHESIYTTSGRLREMRGFPESPKANDNLSGSQPPRSELTLKSEFTTQPGLAARPAPVVSSPPVISGNLRIAPPTANNDLRPHYFPVETRTAPEPWPTRSDAPAKAVQPTAFNTPATAADGPACRIEMTPGMPSLHALPPVSETQSLPPTTATTPLRD